MGIFFERITRRGGCGEEAVGEVPELYAFCITHQRAGTDRRRGVGGGTAKRAGRRRFDLLFLVMLVEQSKY